MNNKPYDAMTHDEILREHTARYEKMTANERLQQKDAFLKLPAKESDHGMNTRTVVFVALIASVFGYWQSSIAAGAFAFLAFLLFTVLFFRAFSYIHAVKGEIAT